MGKERPNYMPNEKAFEPMEFHPLNETDFDPEKIVRHAARRFCEPSESIYKNSPELMDDPLKAIEAVDWHGAPLSTIKDPVEALAVTAAKLTTAENGLNLNPKQKEIFGGLRQNLEGAMGFLSTLESELKSKVVRTAVTGATILGMAIGASGCGDVIGSYVEITPTTSPVTEITPAGSPTETAPSLPTFGPSVTETESSPQVEVAPYPISSENFTKTPSISGAEAEKRIIELGVGGDLAAMKDWYRKSGIADQNMLPVLYEQGGEVYWNLAAKSGNGSFLKFTITSGEEANQDVRAMGMAAYLLSQPSFKTSELKTPDLLSGTVQEMMWDKNGWSVIGTFREGTMVGWFNADKNMWVAEESQVVEATPTPEQTEIHSSFEINGEVEGVPVKVTFSIAKDTYERETRPLDRWEFNPAFIEKYGEEEARNLMSQIIMKAHFFAWQEDNWGNRKDTTLSNYIQRIKNGEDMSYEIYATDRDSIIKGERKMVDPTKPVEIIQSQKMGGAYFSSEMDAGSMFVYVEDGSLITETWQNPEYAGFENFPKNDPFITVLAWDSINSPLIHLSLSVEYQIPGNQTDAARADYQIKLMEERPELDQVSLDFYKFHDLNSNDYSLIMVPLQIRER